MNEVRRVKKVHLEEEHLHLRLVSGEGGEARRYLGDEEAFLLQYPVLLHPSP